MRKIKFDTEKLPSNIILIGEKDEKSIYIALDAYKKIHKFTKNKHDNESGGFLVGEWVEAFNKKNILIYDFVEARYTEATKTTLTFTHKTWDYLYKEIEKRYEDAKIVGWIHTHPGFGIFLSDYDKFIQNNFFSDENQVAYVIDPIQDTEGFFAIINNCLQKCKGFYLFDEIGKEIVIDENKKDKIEKNNENQNEEEVDKERKKYFDFKNAIILLLIVVDLLLFGYFNHRFNTLLLDINNTFNRVLDNMNNLNRRLSNLENNMQELIESKNDVDNAQNDNETIANHEFDNKFKTELATNSNTE